MIALSVNINKIATLRNARGGIIPNVTQHAKNIELLELMELLFTQDQMRDILLIKMLEN